MIESLRTWRLLLDIRRQARRTAEDQSRLQSALLRDAVGHAYARVPLYRRMWDEAEFDPRSVRGVADLERIPPLAPEAARSALGSGELFADAVDADRLPSFPSSGSSGRSMRVPRGRVEQRIWRAVALSMWLEHGYRWSQVTAHLDPTAGPPHALQRFGISRTRWISPELPLEDQAESLADAGADVVVGTPTVLRRVAGAIGAAGLKVSPARIVFTQGELPDARTSDLVRRVFGVAPVALYGMTEVGYVAWQCENRGGYHVNASACVVEVVRDGRPAEPGEVGAVLVTNLRGRTAPLIRYDTGDLATAADGSCPCGRPMMLLRAVEGRARDEVALADGRRLTTRAVVEHMASLLPPDRYRLCQETPGRFRLHLSDPPPPDAAAHLRRLLGDVEIHTVAGVPPAPTPHKSRPLEQALTAAPPPSRR